LEFLFEQIMSLYKPPVQILLHLSSFLLLHPSKAHRICSVKMAGCFGKEDFEIFTFILIICFCLAFGPELACSGWIGG
jgi:hypothetical protein